LKDQTPFMNNKLKPIGIALILLFSCSPNDNQLAKTESQPLTEFSNYYSTPTSTNYFSDFVADTFRIFQSLPQGYSSDTERKYPLIIILDGNAFFESTVSELKFHSFIGFIPKSIVIGIGYKDFMTMDSLRSRDYTYPLANPEYEMALSGGAEKFKRFLDEELIPKLMQNYRINLDQSVICGHSLGGYFTLYYGLKSIEENKFLIKNIVSASPSLHYNNRFLFDMVNTSNKAGIEVPTNIYISMGSEDLDDDESVGILDSFEEQFAVHKYKGLKIKKEEYTNFGHIDAAIPGFMKGLTYIFEK